MHSSCQEFDCKAVTLRACKVPISLGTPLQLPGPVSDNAALETLAEIVADGAASLIETFLHASHYVKCLFRGCFVPQY